MSLARTSALMSEADRLRDVLDPNIPDSVYNPAIHLARRQREVLELLESIRVESGVDRLEVTVGGVGLVYRPKRKGEVWPGQVKRKAGG